MVEQLDLEQFKESAKNKCCLDFNTTLGNTLSEKVKTLYIVLSRMQSIAKRDTGITPNVLVTSPLVLSLLEVTCGVWHKDGDTPLNANHLEYAGTIYNGRWHIYIDPKTYQEHHITMCCCQGGFICNDPPTTVKVSLTNFLMSNLFGYFNM